MSVDDKYLNIISTFSSKVCGRKISFPGFLQEKDGDYILNARITKTQYQKMCQIDDFFIIGTIYGEKITLTKCHLHSLSLNKGNTYVTAIFIPNEVIFGIHCYYEPNVKNIKIETPELNNMFPNVYFEPINYFAKDNSTFLKYSFPNAIRSTDNYGTIRLYQIYNIETTKNFSKFNILSVIEYSFHDEMKLMNAIAKISAAVNLFSFFGNRYISFGDISFEYRKKICKVHLNCTEKIPTKNEPFYIRVSMFENTFDQIWKSWLGIYEGTSPIPSLFYEIVCNHSTRVNCFLNLTQAIEVYSNVNRKNEAKKIAKNDQNNNAKNKTPTLKHRFQDILMNCNKILNLNEDQIENYAIAFSAMRNFYTHYNAQRYSEPSVNELSAANCILRFVILILVYTSVGLSDDAIEECKNRDAFSNLEQNFDTILSYLQKSKGIQRVCY